MKIKKLIQFIDFDPIYNNEGFFSTFYYKIYHFEMKKNNYHGCGKTFFIKYFTHPLQMQA
jgi:hypothetical protein